MFAAFIFRPQIAAASATAEVIHLSGQTQNCTVSIDSGVLNTAADPRLAIIRLGYITPDETELILAHRRDGPRPPERPPERKAPLGRYDVIDVTIEGGAIQFNGRRESYEPLTFRLTRGEQTSVTFIRVRKNQVYETHVPVAFDGRGLHFDLDKRINDPRVVRGRIIIGEERAEWGQGKSYQPGVTLESKDQSASEAQGIKISVRYVEPAGFRR